MKKIIITGAFGFIGSHITENIYRKYPKAKIYLLDKFTYAAKRKYLSELINKKNIKILKFDICQSNLYKKYFHKVDLLINAAAESHVDNSFLNAPLFSMTNAYGVHRLIDLSRVMNVKKIIHLSTDEVYGSINQGSFNEKSVLNPSNPYSASKAAGDMIINSYIRAYNMNIMTVRANNIYGIRQHIEKLIPHCCFKILNNKKLSLHGKGLSLRSFLHVQDFCNALKTVIEKGTSGEIYNISSKNEFSVNQVAKKICNYFDYPIKNISYVRDRQLNDYRYSTNCNKLNKIGWKETKNFDYELKNICEWYSNNFKIYIKK